MKPIEHMDYHPLTERIVETLKVSTGYENSHFFRLTAAYYLGQMASMMPGRSTEYERGILPGQYLRLEPGTVRNRQKPQCEHH